MKTKTNFIAVAKEEVCLMMAVVVCLVVGLGWVKAQSGTEEEKISFTLDAGGTSKTVVDYAGGDGANDNVTISGSTDKGKLSWKAGNKYKNCKFIGVAEILGSEVQPLQKSGLDVTLSSGYQRINMTCDNIIGRNTDQTPIFEGGKEYWAQAALEIRKTSTASPQPTPTPTPQGDLTAKIWFTGQSQDQKDLTIDVNKTTKISWSSTGANKCLVQRKLNKTNSMDWEDVPTDNRPAGDPANNSGGWTTAVFGVKGEKNYRVKCSNQNGDSIYSNVINVFVGSDVPVNNSYKLTMGIVESVDEAKDIIRLRIAGKATVDCEGVTKEIDFNKGTAENIEIPAAGKNCKIKLESFGNTNHYNFYGYTQGKNLKSAEIDTYHKKLTITKQDNLEIKPDKDDLIHVRWYLKRKADTQCVEENKTVKKDEICCENLVEKDGKCVTNEVANKMKVKFLGGAYDATKTTKTISKNIVSMNLECDGNTTELTKTFGSKKLTEYGNFTFNINMPTTAKCTLNNTSENKDYKFKGYTICQNKDIPNCHKNQKINSDESIDLTEYDLKNNDKLQVRWYYEKVGTGSDDGETDNGTDNVSTSRVNRLIELLEKLLEKLGVK